MKPHRPQRTGLAALLACLLLVALVLGQASAHAHDHAGDGDESGICALCLLAQQGHSPLAFPLPGFYPASHSELPSATPILHRLQLHTSVFAARAPPAVLL